jgi:Tol biopolymer transport system component
MAYEGRRISARSITNDDFHDWFPHVSPDGKTIVFLSFLKEEVDPAIILFINMFICA